MALQSFPLDPRHFEGGRNLLFELPELLNTLDGSAVANDPALATIIFRSAAEVEALFPAVAGVHKLAPDTVYQIRGVLAMGSNTFKGTRFYFIANSAPNTFIFTDSPNPLIESDGPGYINIVDCALRNTGGPIVNIDLGSDPIFSVFRIIGSIFFGGRATGQG